MVLLVPALALAGCGGDGETGGGEDKTGAGSTAPAADCATDVVATLADGSEVGLDRTLAKNVGAGTAYTVHAADFEIADAGSSAEMVPAENGHLATLAITTYSAEDTPEQVTPGTTLEWTDDSRCRRSRS